jgi:hypothetical protein
VLFRKWVEGRVEGFGRRGCGERLLFVWFRGVVKRLKGGRRGGCRGREVRRR